MSIDLSNCFYTVHLHAEQPYILASLYAYYVRSFNIDGSVIQTIQNGRPNAVDYDYRYSLLLVVLYCYYNQRADLHDIAHYLTLYHLAM